MSASAVSSVRMVMQPGARHTWDSGTPATGGINPEYKMYSARLTRRGEKRLRNMKAHRNQGKALARSSNLRKSIFSLSKSFYFQDQVYLNSPFFLNSFYFSKTSYLRTTLRNRSGVSSLHNRGATTVRTDYTQLGIPIHTAYVALKLAYANSSHVSS